ncbi:MAG: integrase, partial [Clostridia bacterium]|nr:integrase [Clostridia bacterium]
MADYFKERDKENTQRLLEIRDDLPDFCEEFFIGIESLTSVLTRLGYAYDLRIFFDYLVKRVQYFKLKKDPKNIE